jgi:hypothetical protein
MHLLAAMEHTSRRVLAQREVDGAPGEVPGFVPLLAPVDLAGAVVTADALHTTVSTPTGWWPTSRRTTCSQSRPTSPRCWTAASGWPGTTCPSWTGPATTPTAGWRSDHPRPLGDRERTAPRARRHLRRRRPPGHPRDQPRICMNSTSRKNAETLPPGLASARRPALNVMPGRCQRLAGRRRGRCCRTGRKTLPTVRPERP